MRNINTEVFLPFSTSVYRITKKQHLSSYPVMRSGLLEQIFLYYLVVCYPWYVLGLKFHCSKYGTTWKAWHTVTIPHNCFFLLRTRMCEKIYIKAASTNIRLCLSSAEANNVCWFWALTIGKIVKVIDSIFGSDYGGEYMIEVGLTGAVAGKFPTSYMQTWLTMTRWVAQILAKKNKARGRRNAI